MRIYQGHMYMYVQDMKLLRSNLQLGGLSTDDDANTQWTIHDYTGSSAFMQNKFLYQKC